jgi:hypothetical protein
MIMISRVAYASLSELGSTGAQSLKEIAIATLRQCNAIAEPLTVSTGRQAGCYTV